MTDLQKVRLKTGAVISDTFTDAEILAFLEMEGSVNMAAAAAIESWAAGLLSGTESEHIGDYSYSKKSVDNALALAERLRNAEAETPVTTWAEMRLIEDDDEETE